MSTTTPKSDNLNAALKQRNEKFHHDFRETDSYADVIGRISSIDDENIGEPIAIEDAGLWNGYVNSVGDAVYEDFGDSFSRRVEGKLNKARYEEALDEIALVARAYEGGLNWKNDREAALEEIELDGNSALSDERFERVMRMKVEGYI
jgi:hypothetical protein